jgi:hypothetical protein
MIILICLSLSVCAPFTVTHTHSGDDASLVTLDVCQSAGTAIAGGDDEMPAIDECPHKAYDLEPAGFCDIPGRVSARYIFTYQRERPPEISPRSLAGVTAARETFLNNTYYASGGWIYGKRRDVGK